MLTPGRSMLATRPFIGGVGDSQANVHRVTVCVCVCVYAWVGVVCYVGVCHM